MRLLRLLPLFIILSLLILSGCYRTADDGFETITNDDMIPAQSVTTEAESVVDMTPTVLRVLQDPTIDTRPDEDEVEPTATLVIIRPTIELTAVEEVVDDSGFITPEAVQEMEVPTATLTRPPLNENTSSTNPDGDAPMTDDDDTVASGLQATGNDTDGDGIDDECIYVIKGGDTLFRIALNNDVTLADLLEANDLSENAVIQPEQELIIPDCDPNATSTPEPIVDVDTEVSDSRGQRIHIVEAGETLGGIAYRNDTTVRDLMEANDLTNADTLSIGQRLIIPSDDDVPPVVAPSATPTATATRTAP